MPIELSHDYFPEIIQNFNEILEGIKRLKKENSEKDKRIEELENKLKEYKKNGG
jgi:hypothetical protein